MSKRKDNRLPKYVYPGRSAYEYKPYLGKGVARTTYRLCALDAPISEVWASYEALIAKDVTGSLSWLLDTYAESPKFSAKAARTQKEQLRQAEKIKQYPLKGGRVFGDLALTSITPGVIQKYLDRRLEQNAGVAGNREKALISAAWSWGLARDMTVAPNPCRLVERNTERPRSHYATDRDYDLFVAWCKENAPPYVWIITEIAYLCRMRKSEVINAKKSQILAEGFDTLRSKGSRDAITGWSPRLRAAIDEAQSNPAATFSQYVVNNTLGRKLTVSGYNSVRNRAMKRAVKELGITPFTTHDLKRKGATDSTEDATVSTGNTPSMSKVYDVSKLRAKPTK